MGRVGETKHTLVSSGQVNASRNLIFYLNRTMLYVTNNTMNLVTMHYPLLSDCPSTLEGQSFSNTLTHLVESMLVFFKTAYSSDTFIS